MTGSSEMSSYEMTAPGFPVCTGCGFMIVEGHLFISCRNAGPAKVPESYITWKSAAVLKEGLKEHGMEQLLREIEMPLVFVLSDMEQDGICIDANALKEYGQKLSVSIGELEQKIYEEAGETFNINSPKQLGVILFEKMQLPNGKKTKTGFSTSAEVLEKLAGDYPIVADILEYRKLSKLKSTYADGLSNFIDATGKIHTTFHQTITATGRLSSTDPNLQNIPIRIELGKMIRKVFHPMPGDLFVDSDYSQIELRLLAHMSGDEQLIEAFRENQDIHRSTASKVFHVPFDEVTDLQREKCQGCKLWNSIRFKCLWTESRMFRMQRNFTVCGVLIPCKSVRLPL